MTLTDLLDPIALLLIFGGTIFGLIFGAIPGLTGSTALSLIIPITYAMSPIYSVSILIGTFIGGLTGGLVSAILLRIPGTAASIATVFDGYPMAQRGEANRALGAATFASFFGGMFSTIILLFTAPLLAQLSIGFGAYEYFAISVFALSIVSMLIRGNPLKGLVSCAFGLVLACVGSSPLDGRIRMTFGVSDLNGGFEFLSMMIGLFAFSEIFRIVGDRASTDKPIEINKKGRFLPSFKEIWQNKFNLLRSSAIGTGIGILPGMGGSIASMIAYAQAKKHSKKPEDFGKGALDGVVSVESANNAVTGGALIPMLTLGIPGESVSALLMSGLAIQGFTMGPILFIQSPDTITTFIGSVFIANIMMFVVMCLFSRWFCKVLQVPKYYLYPFIMLVCFIGIFGATNIHFNLLIAIIFGLIGYFFEKNDYPIAPMILALILGPMVESNMRKTIIYYGSLPEAFSQFSIGNIIMVVTILLLGLNIFSRYRASKKAKAAAAAASGEEK